MSFLGNLGPTYLSGEQGGPIDQSGHVVLVNEGDTRGPRILGIPRNIQRHFALGNIVEDTPAVDQFGESYYYDGERDVWVPEDAIDPSYDDQPLGFGTDPESVLGPLGRSRRARRRSRRKAMRESRGQSRARRRARRRRVFRRVRRKTAKVLRKIRKTPIFRAIQRGVSKLLSNKAVQKIAGKALSVFGIPPRVTQAALARESDLLKRGGRIKLAQLIAEGKTREAAQLLKGGIKPAIQAAMRGGPLGACAMAGEYDNDSDTQTIMYQAEMQFPVAHVAGFIGLGDVDPDQIIVSQTPEPGKWYRIKKGDSLFVVTQRAFRVKPGSERLKKARWINRVPENRVYAVDPKSPIDSPRPAEPSNLFPEGQISFSPRFAEEPEQAIAGVSGRSYALIYIPLAEGDRPPQAPEPEPEIEPEPLPTFEPELEPEPVLPSLPLPPPPIVPDPEPELELEPEPEPVPPPEVERPPVIPIETEDEKIRKFREACERTGGKFVITEATGPGCVHCKENEVWSDAAGRCIPRLIPSAPPRIEPTIPDPTAPIPELIETEPEIVYEPTPPPPAPMPELIEPEPEIVPEPTVPTPALTTSQVGDFLPTVLMWWLMSK